MLFAKDLPKTTVHISEGWVKLRPLSQGEENSIQSKMVGLVGGMNLNTEKYKGMEFDDMVEELFASNTFNFVEKQKEIEYERLSYMISEWSAEEEISVDNIKALSKEAYERILEEADKLNNVSEEEGKN